ncbi:uncharacterized protein LOC143127373 [Alosa pseudoharengus]|uniref:uncharacterized protein LOC143127373 n=1 Tax=Alosa pseudoharengus TaxID=34774 RepID=UPI003F8C49DC
MKLSTILGLLCMLISEVAALTCYNCYNDTYQFKSCNNETCPESDGYCASRTLVGGYRKVHEQMCVSSHSCISGSINLGFSKYTVNTECCKGDLCNDEIAPELNRNNTANGRECFTCEGGDCTKTLSCVGDEDVCIASLWNYQETVKGCASLALCLSARIVAYNLSWTTCCKGNLCNSESWHPYDYHGYPSHPHSDEHQHDPHSDDHYQHPTSDDYYYDPHSDNHHPTSDDYYYDPYPCEGIFCSSTKTVGQSVLLLLGSLLSVLLVH